MKNLTRQNPGQLFVAQKLNSVAELKINKQNRMKPTRNRIFCYGCRKQKMLFETQAKADNFIRYNSEGILEENGKAPVRSYYCEMCGGYHVTSNPSAEVGERFNQRDRQLIHNITAYQKEIEEVKALSALLSKRLERIMALLFFGQVDEAEDLLDICNLDIEEISSHPLRGTGKLTTLRGRVDKMYKLMASVKDLLGKTEEEQANYISNPTLEKDDYTLGIIISNVRTIREIDALLNENESSLANCNTDDVSERLFRCQELLANIQRAGKKEVTAKYNTLFDEQQRKLNKLQAGKLNATIKPKAEERITTDNKKALQYFNEKEYKSAILSLIERLEIIQKTFNDGDYDTCETALEIAYYMLDEIQANDDNTTLIKRQLDQWTERINNMKGI